jgi:hypothetical protein
MIQGTGQLVKKKFYHNSMFDVAFSLPTAIVSIDVESSEVGEQAASVDITTRHRHTQTTPISINRKLQHGSSS